LSISSLLILFDLLALHLARGSSCLPTESEGAPLQPGVEGMGSRRCRYGVTVPSLYTLPRWS
jgi:hypothetical protein